MEARGDADVCLCVRSLYLCVWCCVTSFQARTMQHANLHRHSHVAVIAQMRKFVAPKTSTVKVDVEQARVYQVLSWQRRLLLRILWVCRGRHH